MYLSERAKQLILLSKIVSFATWKDKHTQDQISIFQLADEQGRYLTASELEQIKILSGDQDHLVAAAGHLSDRAQTIVELARKQVLAQFPGIIEAGGDLYPVQRAEACWRDFWHFLRCITYGIAGQTIPFTNPEGLKNMELLYQELKVPLRAMVCGLESLKVYSLQEFDEEKQQRLVPYFDHLINSVRQFSPKTRSER